MGKRIIRFSQGNDTRFGEVVDDEVRVMPESFATLAEFLAAYRQGEARSDSTVPLSEVKIESPVTLPARIVCQGANYASHRAEAGMQPQRPQFNQIFFKSDSSLCSPTSNIVKPQAVRLLDYEIEVGLVIGAAIDRPIEVTEENFCDYVAGLVIADDVSARDVQLLQGQWFKGKSYRTFCPTGPYLYLLDADEAQVIHNLQLTLSVNGEVRQSAHTKQLLFKPEETLTELSGIVDFQAGDLLLTGTPGGVALNVSADVMSQVSSMGTPYATKEELLLQSQLGRGEYLKPGDEVRCEVRSTDGTVDLGVQLNRVV